MENLLICHSATNIKLIQWNVPNSDNTEDIVQWNVPNSDNTEDIVLYIQKIPRIKIITLYVIKTTYSNTCKLSWVTFHYFHCTIVNKTIRQYNHKVLTKIKSEWIM